METLDTRYPNLSQMVTSVLGIDLEQLASRAPAQDYEYFDLERLLAHSKDYRRMVDADSWLAPFATQVAGYIATIEAYVALGVAKDPFHFVTKKLLAPEEPRASPPGAEMLDTLVECSWGLWLHDQHGNLEEECLLPDGLGNADFCIRTTDGPLWVDCVSVGPTSDRNEIATYFSDVVLEKWTTKFGKRGAASLPTAVAVTLLKKQEHVLHSVTFDQTIGRTWTPADSLWTDCPGLRHAWFAVPPWHEHAHRPEILAMWTRP